jgi:hypothetical protein
MNSFDQSAGSGSCWSCGNTLSYLDYGRGDTCSRCGRDTRVCKGCVFYHIQSNNQCRESQADRVVEKERSNFCDYFKPSLKSGPSDNSSRESLRSAAEALFKKK